MKIQSPSSIQISFKDVGEFTHGIPDLDLVDVTGTGILSNHVADSGDIKLRDVNFDSNSPNFINNPGSFVYRMDLTLDSEKLENSGIIGFLVDIFPEQPKVIHADNFDDINNILNKSKTIISTLNNQQTQRLQVSIDYRSDLSLAKNKTLVDSANDDIVLTVLSQTPMAGLNKNELAPIKFDQLAYEKPPDINNLSVKSFMDKSLTAGLDPFTGLSESELGISAESKLSLDNTDIFPFNEDVIRIKNQLLINEVSLASMRAVSLAEKYASSGFSEASEQSQKFAELIKSKPTSPSKVQLAHVSELVTRKFRVIRDIEIPKNLIGQREKFFVKIKPVLGLDGTTDTAFTAASSEFAVDHSQQLNEMLEPIVPPTISVIENLTNKIIIGVKSADPTTSKLKVTRKVYDPRLKKFVKTLTFNTEKDQIVDIGVDNLAPNKVMYTASALGTSDASGPTSEIIVDGVHSINIAAKEQDITPKVHTRNTRPGIEVVVENISGEINGLRVVREHISGIGDFKSRIRAVTDRTGSATIDPAGRTTIRLLDTDVHDHEAYRYFLVLNSGLGIGYDSEQDDVIIRKYPRYELPYQIFVGDPALVQGTPKVAIQIELGVQQSQNSFEFFIDLLSDGGADKFFLDEIKKQRNSFTDILAFLIERVDTTTGKKVSLGIHRPGTFMDVGSTKEGLGIQPGRKYVYKIKVCIKPIESFFKNLFSSLTNPSQTSGTEVTKFLSKKFLSTAERHLGVIPSDFEIRQSIDPKTQLVAAETGLTYAKIVTTPKKRPKVINFKAAPKTHRDPKSIKLTWEISGDPREVITALVFCENKLGQKCIGRVAAAPDVQNYYFIDDKKFNEVGTKLYTVVLFYDDFVFSSPSREIKMVKNNNIPRSMSTRGRKNRIRGSRSR